MKLKGTLRLERQSINILLCVSIFALFTCFLLEYALSFFLPEPWYTMLHPNFIVNVLLGISGSSIISMLCILIPHLSGKKEQLARITSLIKNVYCDYEKILFIIRKNSQGYRNEHNYHDEVSLIESTKQLVTSINLLTNEYRKVDFSTEKMNGLIMQLNEKILPIAQIVENFTLTMIPLEFIAKPTEIPLTMVNKYFDIDENRALYELLVQTIEKIIPYEDILRLFTDYISTNEASNVILKNSINELVESANHYNMQHKVFVIQLELNAGMMKLREEFQHTMFKKEDYFWKRIEAIVNLISSLTENKKNEYIPTMNKIYEAMHEKKFDSVEKMLSELERKLSE